MADTDQVAGFWLPSEFLTDDDEDHFLSQKQNSSAVSYGGAASFPPEFPYLKNGWMMSTSPQSTLARSLGGSSNGSPPTTPLGAQNDDVMDLISRAAGQVASLNLSDSRPTVPVGPRKAYSPHFFPRNSTHFQKQNVVGPRNRSRIGEMGQAAWTMKQNPTRFVNGSGRSSAGTGVFLPRARNESHPCNGSDSRKRPSPFGLVPSRTINHACTKSYGSSTGGVTQFQPRYNRDIFVQDYELLMAQRDAIMLQRRKLLLAQGSSIINRDMYLPPDWSY